MATIQLGTTTSASKLSNYAEKRAVVKDGYNVDIDYAKSQMRITREMFAKNDGIQAHHVIQSFKPDEVTPEQANQIGVELAEKIAPNHEVSVYTHDDTNHVHNHLVINSVNFETGMKYQAHGQEAIERTRSMSDEICQKYDLSIVTEHTAPVRHTLAEQHLLDKKKSSWKEEIREAIDYTKERSTDFDSFKRHLQENYEIEAKLRGKTLSFKHPDQKRFIRANKLGFQYELEGLNHVFTRQAERKQEHERFVSRNEGTERIDDQLYQSSHERGNGEGLDDTDRIRANSTEIKRSHEEHAIDLEQAKVHARGKQRSFARDFSKWTRGDSEEQPQDDSSTRTTSSDKQRATDRDERGNQNEHEQSSKESRRSRSRSKERDEGLSL